MRRALVTVAAVALVAVAPSPARAAVAAAGPGGFAAGFLTPVVVAAEGEVITFHNADVAPHDFVADGVFLSKKQARKAKWCTGFDAGKCPLFWSPKIGVGQETDVLGIEFLKAGKQYPFFCSVHPNMKGTLAIR